MPRLTNQLPKYRKHSSGKDRKTLNARVTINGRDYLLGPYGTRASKNEYDRIIAEYLASGRSPSFGLSDDLLICEVMLEYLKHCRRYYGTGATSELHRVKLALRPLQKLYGKQTASDFGPKQLKAVRETMVRDGLSRTGINARIKRVVRMFRWAAEEELLPASVHATLKLVSGLKRGKTEARETEPIKPVEWETVVATMEHLPPVVRDMVRVQFLTGCRPQDVCGLHPGCIDRSGEIWVATPADHKTAYLGRDRKIYMGAECQAIIRPYLLRAENAAMFSPAEAMKQRRDSANARRVTPASCGNRPGKRAGGLAGTRSKKQPAASYTATSYRRAIHYACDAAFKPTEKLIANDLKRWQSDHRWSPNRLRHTRGTEVRQKYGLEAAQVFLGHAAANVTQVYAERDEAKAREVARAIG